MIIIAAILFVLHLFFETMSTFVRYSYAALGVHMQGANYSNIFAIVSRGFIALYGLLVAVMIEKLNNNINVYIICMIFAFLISACVSLYFSKIKLITSEIKNIKVFQYKIPNEIFYSHKLSFLMSIFIGIQFTAIVVAYTLCFKFKEFRLLIISLIPVFSMIGTLITVLLVEPKFAKHIDVNRESGHAIASVYLYARAISFSVSAGLLFLLWIFIK